jgi:hypothetical protein
MVIRVTDDWPGRTYPAMSRQRQRPMEKMKMVLDIWLSRPQIASNFLGKSYG